MLIRELKTIYPLGLFAGWCLVVAGLMSHTIVPVIIGILVLLLVVHHCERHRLRESLGRSEARFRALADHSPMLIWKADPNGECDWFNRSWYDFTGRLFTQEAGHGWKKFIHVEDQSRIQSFQVHAILERKPFTWEFRLLRKDHYYRWLMLQGSPVWEIDGSCSGWIGSAVDITDRKRAENLFRVMVESAPFGILLLRPNGDIELANRLAEQILNQDRHQLVKRNIQEFLLENLPIDDITTTYENGSCSNINLESKQRIEATATTSEGEILSLEIGLNPIKMENGEFILLSIQDIGEQLRARQAMHHAREMAVAANQAKSNFLAMISHELRTPINGILGMCDLLARTSLNQKQAEYVQLIQGSSDSLLSVIRNILDVSKIEAGKFELEVQPFSLRQQINTVLMPLRHKAESKNLAVLWEVDEDLPDRLIGDGERLGQILTNLVNNAIKFTDQGSIQIQMQCEDWTDDLVTVKGIVRDTGIGIPEEHKQRIFFAFEQVDPSRKRSHDGAGLGLAIVIKLVELMNGRIWVDSVAGQGSCFQFIVELKWSGESHGTELLHPPSRILYPSNILLAEDNVVNQRVIVESLKREGHRIEVASTGKQVIDNWEIGNYDLILMDIRMPEMDGLEATRLIREREQVTGNHIPIIALTAQAMRGDAEHCLAAGCDAYHPKPVRLQELLKTMTRLLGKPTAPSYALDHAFIEQLFGAPAYDAKQALIQCHGNSGLLLEVKELFLQELPKLMQKISTALESRDLKKLLDAAHSLKGSATYLAAKPTVDAAIQMEVLCREANWESLEDAYQLLQREADRLREAIENACPRVTV